MVAVGVSREVAQDLDERFALGFFETGGAIAWATFAGQAGWVGLPVLVDPGG